MGCVIANLSCKRLDAPIKVETLRIDKIICVSTYRIDNHIGVYVKRIGDSVAVVGTRLDEPIVVKCSIICDTWLGDVLRVSPEVMWLTEANGFTGVFEVMANVKWNVE